MLLWLNIINKWRKELLTKDRFVDELNGTQFSSYILPVAYDLWLPYQ